MQGDRFCYHHQHQNDPVATVNQNSSHWPPNMTTEPRLFRVNPADRTSRSVPEVEFANLGLQERRDIQEWIVANPGILGEDLLIIAKEFSDFDNTNDRLDLLAVDSEGKLVIIELKRDNSGVDVHWQAIKYASYLRHATQSDIVGMLASHENVSQSDAEERLAQHVESGALENLNSNQRIILASHRFAREVTSAALWLNDKSGGENLITCVQLIPHQDGDTLYVQSNTIIPVAGTEPYTIQVGRTENDATVTNSGIRGTRRNNRRSDEITKFALEVEARTKAKLPERLITDSNYRWAKGRPNYRWYSMWYENRYHWSPNNFNYIVHIAPHDNSRFTVINNFEMRKSYLRNKLKYTEEVVAEFRAELRKSVTYDMPREKRFIWLREHVTREEAVLDEPLAERTAESLAKMIEELTETVDAFVEAHSDGTQPNL